MPGAYVKCGSCSYSMDPEDFSPGGAAICRGCKKPLSAAIFPALWKPKDDSHPEALIATEEASCFYHQSNRAVIVCDGCGRFLCKLCDIELQGQHLCPACVEAGVKKKSVAALDHDRVIYGKIAFWFAVIPLFAWPFTCLTAPASIFIAIRYWKRPGSLTGRDGHSYHILAIIFALLEIAGWTAFVIALTMK